MSQEREILSLIPHGLYLVGVRAESGTFLYTASWLTQASIDPLLIATAVRRTHDGHDLIQEARAFTVNLLPKGQLDLARVGFANPEDRLFQVRWKECPHTGAPVVLDSLAYLACRLVRWVDCGDHDLAVAEVVGSERFAEGELLTIQETPWTYS
jgi:flavin reductase (DIM6/NTAB) family NADH-FMN oxidoreductase RutF